MVSEVPSSSHLRSSPLRAVGWLFRTASKLLLLLIFIGAGLFAGGFLKFSNTVEAYTVPANVEAADGVVALTGGAARIAKALDLIADSKGQRLLISGVNPETRVSDIANLNANHRPLFDCCVDVESRALNTVGNAEETGKWAKRNGYRSLILVTSSYHMPRSILEFRRQIPSIKLIAYPVPLKELNRDGWWGRPEILRVMLSEYTKYIGAWLRDYLDPKTIAALRAGMWGG